MPAYRSQPQSQLGTTFVATTTKIDPDTRLRGRFTLLHWKFCNHLNSNQDLDFLFLDSYSGATMPRSVEPKSRKAHSHAWFYKNIAGFLFLMTCVLFSIFSSSRKIEVRVAASSSRKEKGPTKNKTEAFYDVAMSSSEEEGYSADNDATTFYDTTWPPLQKALCGEGAPNLLLSSLLFMLARSEVFAEDDPRARAANHTRASTGHPSKTQLKFFSGEYGASVFRGFNEKGDRFATVYVRLWKCGNNQIRWMEQKLFKHFNGTYERMHLWNALRAGNSPPPCIYTAVRDPIAHFLSGYNEVEVRQLGEYNNQSAADWPSSSKPAPYHISSPYSSESPYLRQERFKAFVEDVLLEEPTFAIHYVYSHFFPMSRILVNLKKHDLELTGYIPQLENITSTWPTFMSSNCENFPSPEVIPTMKEQGQHKSSRDRLGLYRAAKEVWKEAGPIARSLCLLHAFDYACFEDLPERIPALCRSVYQDYAQQILDRGSRNYFIYKTNGTKSAIANLSETTR